MIRVPDPARSRCATCVMRVEGFASSEGNAILRGVGKKGPPRPSGNCEKSADERHHFTGAERRFQAGANTG